MIVSINCLCCNAEDLEIEVKIDFGGMPGNYGGLPEYSYPGEGAEWHAEADVTCSECNVTFTVDELNENTKLDEAVNERLAEPDEPDIEW